LKIADKDNIDGNSNNNSSFDEAPKINLDSESI